MRRVEVFNDGKPRRRVACVSFVNCCEIDLKSEEFHVFRIDDVSFRQSHIHQFHFFCLKCERAGRNFTARPPYGTSEPNANIVPSLR